MATTYTIPKGKHRAWPFRFGLFLSKKKIRYRVAFDHSCKYILPGNDQQDINKLFGIGYFPSHHKESARFGWRWNAEKNKIEVFAYCYVNGQRITGRFTDIPLHQSFVFELSVLKEVYVFTVYKESFETICQVQYKHKRKWSFPLGVYFGGNQTAPHKITIELKKA